MARLLLLLLLLLTFLEKAKKEEGGRTFTCRCCSPQPFSQINYSLFIFSPSFFFFFLSVIYLSHLFFWGETRGEEVEELKEGETRNYHRLVTFPPFLPFSDQNRPRFSQTRTKRPGRFHLFFFSFVFFWGFWPYLLGSFC